MTCSICDRPAKARGWCSAHYQRWWRFGNPLAGGTMHGDPQKFIASALAYDGEECLIWPFARFWDGYPHVAVNRKSKRVSRLICEKIHGKPPTSEHEAAHSCGNGEQGCLTPRHLRWATKTENIAERWAKK